VVDAVRARYRLAERRGRYFIYVPAPDVLGRQPSVVSHRRAED
jgi:hypothetical protein